MVTKLSKNKLYLIYLTLLTIIFFISDLNRNSTKLLLSKSNKFLLKYLSDVYINSMFRVHICILQRRTILFTSSLFLTLRRKILGFLPNFCKIRMIWGQDFSEINVNGQSLGHDTQKVISEKVENYRTLLPVFGHTFVYVHCAYVHISI